MCSAKGLLPQESMPPTPICNTSMHKALEEKFQGPVLGYLHHFILGKL
jgi:hypothetical protein